MSTEMLDVLSVLDEQDNPVLGNCTLVLGEVALEFKNGRSVVPVSKAPEVARCPKIRIPGYKGPIAPPVPSISAQPGVEPGPEDKINAAVEYLREQGMEGPFFAKESTPTGIVLHDGSKPIIAEGDGIEKAAIEVPVGQEHTLEASESVQANGELPGGFEELTPAGEPRCAARTGSGTQCSNAASPNSRACGLGAHQEQFSS